MLTFFRTNQVFYSVMLLVYALLLRFSVFIAPFQWEPSGHGILSEMLYSLIGSQGVVAHIVAMVLLMGQGYLVNLIGINYRLSNEINLFPGLFYVWCCCAIPDFLYLSPVLLGNTFLIIALYQIFDTYKNPACADKIFNAGLWLGVASLFYFPFAFFLIVLLAALSILRTFNLQELLMIVVGMLLPYLLVGIYYFWFDSFSYFYETQIGRNFGFFEFAQVPFTWDTWVKLALFVVAMIYVLANSNFYLAKKNIQVQKKINILYWVLIAAGLSVPFQANLTFEHLMMLAPALGIFLGLSFTSFKPQWAEALHFLMVVLVLALQFVPWQL
ncbi:MAG: hypothetical protein IT258_10020 [Saprospiraceae bacterium]|nr:hypothetical protein [Saprospiraceae bacterium]